MKKILGSILIGLLLVIPCIGYGEQAIIDPTTTATSATGVAAAAVTLTIAAAPAGLFLYVTELEIVKFATALLTAAATPVLCTTTGITGTPTISFSAGAELAGSAVRYDYGFGGRPLKGSAAATAITIVCPATTAIIWRINGFSFVGP